MINTSDSSELKSCINNAQDVIMEMGPIIDTISDAKQKDQLKKLSSKMGTLLKESNQRCDQVLKI